MIFNIQSLRAFAALSVAYFHTDVEGVRFGSFEVDVFFVIRGFIMAKICRNDPNDFLLQRLVRIVPLCYWVPPLVIFAQPIFPLSCVTRVSTDFFCGLL